MTIKYSINLENISSYDIINLLKEGKVLETKTDTLPALICDPYSIKAVEGIFSLKKRPRSKQLPLFVPNNWNEKTLVNQWNTWEKKLIKKYWPGPLTIIKKFSNEISKKPVLGDPTDTVALRCPDWAPLLKILEKFGPIASTSSNISGQMSENEANIRSTIVQITENEKNDNKIKVLRSGNIKDFNL
ncbi:MAG: Sua5/YciO/YrdC/YwlC family protein [Bifidobacteriaceae bacterium]|jgi:tRNA threonylcarbamoyl adenosine modification protein (Sua5/YciO/YrdC/YwlC family)|nr:Sua5/YciO/YrdC/YwlC family protein [Bifidobacteriaceae bacterium]